MPSTEVVIPTVWAVAALVPIIFLGVCLVGWRRRLTARKRETLPTERETPSERSEREMPSACETPAARGHQPQRRSPDALSGRGVKRGGGFNAAWLSMGRLVGRLGIRHL